MTASEYDEIILMSSTDVPRRYFYEKMRPGACRKSD